MIVNISPSFWARAAKVALVGAAAALIAPITGCSPSAADMGCDATQLVAVPQNVAPGGSVRISFSEACRYPLNQDVKVLLTSLADKKQEWTLDTESLSKSQFDVRATVPNSATDGPASISLVGGLFDDCGTGASCAGYAIQIEVH